MNEKQIIIDGTELSTGQAMALRMAVTEIFSSILRDREVSEFELTYRERLREILEMLGLKV